MAADYEFTTDWFSSNIPVWSTLIDQIKPRRALEIGCFEGRASSFLIERCAALAPFELVCVDSWARTVEFDDARLREAEARFDRNIALAQARAAHPAHVRKINARSLPALSALIAAGEPEFDFVYVDGSHIACDVLADAVLAFALTSIGGVIGFDDYVWSMEAEGAQDSLNMPKPAIDAFININQRKLRIVQNIPLYQVFVVKTAP